MVRHKDSNQARDTLGTKIRGWQDWIFDERVARRAARETCNYCKRGIYNN